LAKKRFPPNKTLATNSDYHDAVFTIFDVLETHGALTEEIIGTGLQSHFATGTHVTII